jgi:hypothetical protein
MYIGILRLKFDKMIHSFLSHSLKVAIRLVGEGLIYIANENTRTVEMGEIISVCQTGQNKVIMLLI